MESNQKQGWLYHLSQDYYLLAQKSSRLILFIILGPLFHLIVWVKYLTTQKKVQIEEVIKWSDQEKYAYHEQLRQEVRNKNNYLKLGLSDQDINRQADSLLKAKIDEQETRANQEKYRLYLEEASQFLNTTTGFLVALILSFPMFLALLILSSPTASFIANRLIMMVFVIIGVTTIVFTLLYWSPSDPAINILGVQATGEEIASFRAVRGLDDPYIIQLFRAIGSVFTLDFGTTLQGNVPVMADLLSRFPLTLAISIASLVLSLLVALPAGIYAGVKPNSTFDYLFMLLALVGISVPTFWLGLIFILTFSVNLGWLPATYSEIDWTSLIMPVIVLGVGLMASVARMARSSTLEVLSQDYVLTARSKGLSQFKVVLRHVVPNALIPIITIIGLQFSSMLAGSAVTEKVFTIPGIGSYIVDKQFLPDVPAVLGGVVYIAVVLTIVNLVVDILYSFLDPRIRTNIKNGQLK